MSKYENQIKKIISLRAGVDVHEVTPATYFQDDLNIGEIELLEIISDIEEELKVEIKATGDEIQTVEDIINIVTDQLD
ncbi:MAG: Acyl carrier protein [candidate division WWE3 bacterium GW2011_GWA1_46_21]|uniref:Acyl carrier protein n=4 Tax=Katanobacteria TaxID=422282 RepID=A0A0G1PCG7_UNCKA|nr:MAG: Acyl carrier protein [candidate division WWE3 bacterium GW2011_GWA1_46_21]KKU49076.1 MAG: Acyl carrier protein [candidate division WWE3 bacterium GW2011_GWA2_46_9]KKU51115.1 MAG: Acyl carrier protein [candidate division WWE3 bacterium GW2011_GWC1_47_10]KKU57500.1 MAG: Acyl carrier protein [candidate division WWE3 bacterium GW2011_GWB1_47_11]